MYDIVIIGVIISIIFYEFTDITPGGIIVPGLMVLYITEIDRMIYTIVVGIITYFIVKIISRYLIIFGKRRFVMMIIISTLLNLILEFMLASFSINLISISLIGYTIAGIIANNIYKQGLQRTIPALAIVISVLELIVICMNYFGV